MIINWSESTGLNGQKKVTKMDEKLTKIGEKVVRYATIFTVDTKQVPEYESMYELKDQTANLMFFFQNRHIKVDCGTGDANKLTKVLRSHDLVDIFKAVHEAAVEGKEFVSAPRDGETPGNYDSFADHKTRHQSNVPSFHSGNGIASEPVKKKRLATASEFAHDLNPCISDPNAEPMQSEKAKAFANSEKHELTRKV